MFGERLAEVRKNIGLSQIEMAKKLEIDPASLSRYEKNKINPSTPFLEKLAHMQININYLFDGVGSYHIEKEITSANENMIKIEYFKNTYGSMGGGGDVGSQGSNFVSFSKEFLDIELCLNNYKNLQLINSAGDSMEPTIKEGYKLFVIPCENEGFKLRQSGIYVLLYENNVYVKRIYDNLKSIVLKSDNKSYEDIVLNKNEFEDFKIIGRVVGSLNIDKI